MFRAVVVVVFVVFNSVGANKVKSCYIYDRNGTESAIECGKNSVGCAGMIFNGVTLTLFPNSEEVCVLREDLEKHPVYQKVDRKIKNFCFCGIEAWLNSTTYCWCWCGKSLCNSETHLLRVSRNCLDRFNAEMKKPGEISPEKKRKPLCEVGFAAKKGEATFHTIYH